MKFGYRASWAIEVHPLNGAPDEADRAAAATWCALSIWAGGENLTRHVRDDERETVDALYWPAAHLARWLVANWSSLWERDGSPLPGGTLDAATICRRLDERLASDEDVPDEIVDVRDEFVASHALQSAAAGGLMPAVYFLKEGEHFHVTWSNAEQLGGVRFVSARGRVSVDASLFLDVAEGFLTWVQSLVADKDLKLSSAIEQWRERLSSPEAAESVVLGYAWPWGARQPETSEVASLLDSRFGLPPGWRSEGARFKPFRQPAAVVFRALTPSVGLEDVQRILELLKQSPANAVAGEKLRELREVLAWSAGDAPHEQGQELARQLRDSLGNPDRYLDVETLLEQWGVHTASEDLSDPAVDGATVWDEHHGPLIIVNSRSSRTAPWAKRMTVAHELCHLLVDLRAAVPLAVISSPWAPATLERRANAFAAELLLPKLGLARALGETRWSGVITHADSQELMDEFGVGETVCRRQLENRLGMSLEFD